MSDLKTQRNVAIGVAAVAVAFVIGYLVSNGRPAAQPSSVGPAAEPAVTAPAPSAQPSVEPEPSPERAVTPATVRPQVPVAGTRQRPATRPAEPIDDTQTDSEEEVGRAPVEVEEAEAPASPPQVRQLVRVVVPRSTPIVLDLVQAVSSETAQVGDAVTAELAEPIRVDGDIVVPSGARVTGRVSEAQALKKVGGQSILGLSFDRLESGDGGVAIAAGFRREGKSETGKDAATIGAGAAIGTVLGNQAKKNDRGKLIGAIVGAAAGAAVAAKTEGERIELPAGARLELTLQQDVELMIDR